MKFENNMFRKSGYMKVARALMNVQLLVEVFGGYGTLYVKAPHPCFSDVCSHGGASDCTGFLNPKAGTAIPSPNVLSYINGGPTISYDF